jgi:hypothetical protein
MFAIISGRASASLWRATRNCSFSSGLIGRRVAVIRTASPDFMAIAAQAPHAAVRCAGGWVALEQL